MAETTTQIRPQLRTTSLTFIFVSLVIGMGIFRTPVEVAAKAGVPWIFFMAWITGAIVSAIGAMTFAEIGSRHPVAGGFYRIFSIAYSPVFAFMVNWITVISNAVSTAAVAFMGAEYMAPLLLPNLDAGTGIRIISITSILILYGINMLGIKVSSRTINVLMVVKLLLLIAVISVPFVVTSVPVSHTQVSTPESGDNWFHAFILCFVPVFFTYGGYQQLMNFGGDIVNPRKAVPTAAAIGMAVILIVYLSVNYAYVAVLGFNGLQQSTTLAADMIGFLFGEKGHQLVSVLMFLSVMTFVNVSLISNPRVYYAMAEDKVMPSWLMKVNQRTQVQEYGVTFFSFVMLVVLFYLASFRQMLGFVMFFDSISIITAAAAIFVLRNREKKEGVRSEIYRMRGYPWLPVIFVVVYTGVSISVMLAEPGIFLTGTILFIAGYPLFHFIQRTFKGNIKSES